MTRRTITLPMETVSEHTVSVDGYSASCMNCGAKYLNESSCTGCGTVFVFAASEKIGPGVLDLMHAFANERGLKLIGYSDGGCLAHGGGTIDNEGPHSIP